MFEGPKLKIKRANHHIDDLDSRLKSFYSSKFCRLTVENDLKVGSLLVLEILKELPEEIPLVIGDAVHNLRASLDLLYCDIVRLSGEEIDKYAKLPFRDTRDNLVSAIKNGKLKAAKPGVVDVIIDFIQPYEGGNDAICGLHAIDIQDKHILLIPTVTVGALLDVQMQDAGFNVYNFKVVELQGGPKFHPVLRSVSPPITIASYRKAAFNVVFEKTGVFGGQAVVPTLHQLSKFVFESIAAVERAFN